MYVNMDVEMPKTPCSLISVDIADNTGQHLMNVHGSLEKVRMDSNGKILGLEEDYTTKGMTAQQNNNKLDVTKMQQQVQDNEGCRVHG